MKTIPYRRKRTGQTNYKKRLALLKSGKPRLVIRKSNKNIMLQVVSYEPDGDKILVTITSKILEKEGWTHSKKSIPAAYLAGLLLGKTAKEKGVKEVVADLGMQKFLNGSKLTAAIKGVIDSGLILPAGEIFPPEDRLSGKHISDKVAKDFETVKAKLTK